VILTVGSSTVDEVRYDGGGTSRREAASSHGIDEGTPGADSDACTGS